MLPPARLDVDSGTTSSRVHSTSPLSPPSRTATSLAPGPPPATITPSGDTDGGVCARKFSGTDHFGFPSAVLSAHRCSSRPLTYTVDPSADSAGLEIGPWPTASLLHSRVSSGLWPAR